MDFIHEIHWSDGAKQPTRIIPNDFTITIGRGVGCDITLDCDRISRLHCFICVNELGNAFIGNGNPVTGKPSKNGFFIKGNHYSGNALIELKGGENILIGSFLLTYLKRSVEPIKDGEKTFGAD